MIRYLFLLAIYLPFYILAMLVAPLLPVFAQLRWGAIDNNNGFDVAPRLPLWLSWFDTDDNSLYGDDGWRTKHCIKLWDTYLGQVLWLWRNPACGFARQVLTTKLDYLIEFVVTNSGNGLAVDKGNGTFGWFYIKANNGAFHYRYVKAIPFGKVLTFEAGWGLDDYVKDPLMLLTKPTAAFVFQPQIKTAKPK